MRIEKKFVSNYLSTMNYKWGKDSVFIVLGLCIFFSWLYWNPEMKLSNQLAASHSSVIDKGEYWRLFTTSFVHADLKHLLSNSFMLSLLVYFVSSFYGSIISVVLSFVVATITNFIVIKTYGGEINLVGASGVVYYLWGFWMILYMFLQRHYSIINRSLRMGAVFLILLIPNEYQPSTSYLAHYIGFGVGIVVGGLYFLIYKNKLLKAEKWSVRQVSDELTDLDIIALNHPIEEEVFKN